MISQLLRDCLDNKEDVIIPAGLKVTQVTVEDFHKYRGVLGGVTPQNSAEIASQLADLRLGLAPEPVTTATTTPSKVRPNEGGE
jgi:hypothetical protein